jgi:hypothetical protein
VNKKQNLGTYLRTACAFGAKEVRLPHIFLVGFVAVLAAGSHLHLLCIAICKVVVVGLTKFSTHGAHAANKYLKITFAPTFEEAKLKLCEKEANLLVCGILANDGGALARCALS